MIDHLPDDPRPGEPILIAPCEYEMAEWFAAIRWPDGFRCRRCSGGRATHLRSRPRVFECRDCRAQNSVTAGTVLHRTKLPLSKILCAADLISRRGSASSVDSVGR